MTDISNCAGLDDLVIIFGIVRYATAIKAMRDRNGGFFTGYTGLVTVPVA